MLRKYESKDKALVSAKKLALCSTSEARALISYETALKYEVLPLGLLREGDRERLSVATKEKPCFDLEQVLRFSAGREISLIVSRCDDIKQAIFVAYNGDEKEIITSALRLKTITSSTNKEDILRSAKGDVALFLNSLIDYAISKEASDIHIAPRREGTYVTLRVKGKLLTHETPVGDQAIHRQLINRIKILSRLDLTQQQKPLDGSFEVTLPSENAFIRVSTIPTIHGEKAVLRIVSRQEIPLLETLGYSKQVLQAIFKALEKKQGLILFCGPTGSGKSTALYSAIKQLILSGKNVSTLEDPVECFINGAAQTTVNSTTGLDYASGLRAILRQDPDAILIGEIRGKECAENVFNAALTGHLVLSTVHGRNEKDVIKRLRQFGVTDNDIRDLTPLIINQRLVSKLCERCKIVDLKLTHELGFHSYRTVGCSECDYSGFSGVLLSNGFSEGNSEKLTLKDSLHKLLEAGMITVRQYEAEIE